MEAKDNMRIRDAKKGYLTDSSDESWEALAKTLDGLVVAMACNWDVSDDEKSQIENAAIGDSVQIERNLEPTLFGYSESAFGIMVFSTRREIPDEYIRRYAFDRCDFGKAVVTANAFGKVVGKETVILLDCFGDDGIVIDSKMIASTWGPDGTILPQR